LNNLETPPLPGMHYSLDQAPILQLIYKELGDNFEQPQITIDLFLDALISLFSVVYGINNPRQSEYFKYIENQIKTNKNVIWK
jgi:hypothetical protein